MNPPVLRSPNFDLDFIVQKDASDFAIGAVLFEKYDDEEHPVAYFSRKLSARELKYSAVEKECLAIKLALEEFRVYVLGRHFLVETDHRALAWLNKFSSSNARLTRWCLALQAYSFSVRHRPGVSNGNADGLSRL